MRWPLPFCLFVLAQQALARVPMGAFPDCSRENLAACPSDIGEYSWDRVSWVPENSEATIRPAELEVGSGIALDVAVRYSAGRWDVPLAVADSGIEWWDGDLLYKIMLNADELPKPQGDGCIADSYDCDGNGLVNLADYARDPRVKIDAGRDRADDRLDPSDVLYTFSNGVDDDGNGFIDDIAGWDFFDFDNDPFAEPETELSGHGSGVMTEAAGEGDDGGSIGVCPDCAVIPMRVGDVFITDGDRVAMAVAYAADRGAGAMTMAVGALSHSQFTRDAIQYADEHGMVIVSAAGDENSWHHNFPANEAPILYVHSVRSNTMDEGAGKVYSYQSFFNCNNFGPRLDLVAPSNACATGAAAKIGGAAAMLKGAAKSAGVDLTPAEVRALLRTSADDIHLSAEELAISRTYPSGPGWDAFYGYGRLNIGRAVERAVTGDIPPTAQITAPRWWNFESLDGGDIAIEAKILNPRSPSVSWTVEYGTGLDPQTWTPLATGSGAQNGVIATIPGAQVADVVFGDVTSSMPVMERIERAHAPAVTARVTVTDANGRSSSDRLTFWVHRDTTALEGFPRLLDGSGEASVMLADVDGEPGDEVIAATGSGTVHAYQVGGGELPGWPVQTAEIPPLAAGWDQSRAYQSGLTPGREGIIASPAVGDLDGDGLPEVVAASLRGRVYAWHADGSPVSGFPIQLSPRTAAERGPDGRSWDWGVIAAPVLVDIDGDEALEVLIAGLDQRLYLFHGDGAPVTGYPITVCLPELCSTKGSRIVSSPAVGDIDGDGDLDVTLGTNEIPPGSAGLIYAIDLGTAAILPGFPVERDGLIQNRQILPVIGEGHPASPAIGDFDADGRLEIASNAMLGVEGLVGSDGVPTLSPSYLASDFGDDASFQEASFASVANNPVVADVDGDGTLDLVTGGSSTTYLVSLALTRVLEYGHAVGAWSGATGQFLPGFPRMVDDVSFLGTPSVVDVTGDGKPEVLYGTGGGFVYAWDASGALADGFPKFTGGWMIGSPAAGDVDDDGFIDVAVATREGWLFVWRTAGRADQPIGWGSARHDPHNTGNAATPMPVRLGPPEGCCQRRSGGTAAVLLLPLLVALRRRR
jgi:hypothetical protein